MNTRYFTITDPARESAAVEQAADILRRGGLLAIPTETVYGLGADGLNADAVRHIFEAKGRPQDNPLILHIPDASWLARYCKDVPETAYRLAGRFWPGPLTMILPKADCVPLVTTGDPALDQLKATYRSEFAAALRDAISDLSFEDRLLLRQQIADQLSVDEIGAAHGVHRGTAGRWLARAREALLLATQRRLAERLDLPAEEIASVIRLVHSKLDVSVVRYLRDSK